MDEQLDFGDLHVKVTRRSYPKASTWRTTMTRGVWFSVLVEGAHLITQDSLLGRQVWQAGDIYCLPLCENAPDHLHEVLEDSLLAGVFLRFDLDAVSRYFGPLTPKLLAHAQRIPDTADRSVMRRAAKMLTHPQDDPLRHLYMARQSFALAEGIARECFSHLQQGPRQIPQPEQQIRHIGCYLQDHLNEAHTTEFLARYFGVSTRRLNAGFRAVFGMSVHDYLKSERLKRAMSLLRSQRMPISSVAYHVGYHPAHFSTEFRRFYGCSPSQVRRDAAAR